MSTTTEWTAIAVPDAGFVDARFRAKIVGISALLMHSAAGMQATTGLKRTSETNVPLPEDEAEQGAYRLPTGELYVPATAVRGTMVAAAVFFQDPNYRKGTLQKPIGGALGAPTSEGFVLHDGADNPITEYAVDTQRAVLGTGKAAKGVMRSRARIDLPWELWLEFSYDSSLVPADMLALVLSTAGSKTGLLDFRPQKSGPYGRFAVERFEVAE